MFTVFTGKLFLMLGDEVIPTESFYSGKRIEKGKAYLRDEYVYPYRGKITKYKENELPCGVYYREGEYVFVDPSSEMEKQNYHRNMIVDLDIRRIYDEIERHKKDFLTEEEIEVIHANTEIFTPIIKINDDFLKRAIKEAIIQKKINLKIYRDKFKNDHSLNNMKSALSKKSKMSVSYFLDWCEILGLDWSLTITDNGSDKFSVLEYPITITSRDKAA